MNPAARPRLLVTRPRAQAQPWIERLRQAGVDAHALPLIEIAPLDDPAPLHAAWHGLADAVLVMFVSPSAVARFFAARPAGVVWPHGLDAACPGAGTARALQAALRAAGGAVPGQGMTLVSPVPGQPEESESLWALLRERSWAGRRVLIVRGQAGRDWLAERWQEAGAQVDVIAAYAQRPPVLDPAELEWLERAVCEPQAYVFSLSSAQAVDHLRRLAPGADWSPATALVSHPRVAVAARAAGFLSVREVEPGWQGLQRAWVDLESFPL